MASSSSSFAGSSSSSSSSPGLVLPRGDLRALSVERFLHEILGSIPSSSSYRVLVLDGYAQEVLSSFCSLKRVMDHGIAVIENVALIRQPFPELEAIYFVAPCDDSVAHIISDFSALSGRAPLYRAAHILFTSVCPDYLIDRIADACIDAYVLTLTEVNFDYLVVDSRLFSLGRRDSLYLLYSLSRHAQLARDAELQGIAEQLVSLCITFKELPFVRYSSPVMTGDDSLCQDIAERFEARMEWFIRNCSSFQPKSMDRATLLILDRRFDLDTPFLHDSHVEGMTFDTFAIDRGVFQYQPDQIDSSKSSQNADQVSVLLDDSNNCWESIRSLHVADAGVLVNEIAQNIVKSSPVAQYQMTKDRKKVDLKTLVRSMPGYKLENEQISAANCIVASLMKILLQIRPLAQIEEDLVLGSDADGLTFSNPYERLLAALDETMDSMDCWDRLRAILVYVQKVGGLTDAQEEELSEKLNAFHSEDTSHLLSDALCGLQTLGVTTKSKDRKAGRRELKETEESKAIRQDIKRRQKANEEVLVTALNRHRPKLEQIIRNLGSNSLDVGQYPWVKPPPPDSSLGLGPRRKQSSPKSRLIVFVVGALTRSEVRSLYENLRLSNFERPMILGSSEILSGNQFCRVIRGLDDPSPPPLGK